MSKGPGELAFDNDGRAYVTKCNSCNKPKWLAAFAPEPSGFRSRKHAMFVEACDGLASSNPAVVQVFEAALARTPFKGKACKALRQAACRSCRAAERRRLETGKGAKSVCWQAAQAIKADMATKGCAQCIEQRVECFTCEHPVRPDKDLTILKYAPWADVYKLKGPEMMWQEYAQCIVLCRCCHALQKTHLLNDGVPSESMPPGQARRQRAIKEEKRAYVNVIKRDIGVCHYCDYHCIDGNEHAFEFMHKDAREWASKVSDFINKGTVPFKKCKPRLDAEIAKCNLGCSNCHYYYETMPSMKCDNEAWDALEARWIGKLL